MKLMVKFPVSDDKIFFLITLIMNRIALDSHKKFVETQLVFYDNFEQVSLKKFLVKVFKRMVYKFV